MLKVARSVFLMMSVGLSAGCGTPQPLEHLPDDVFEEEPEYSGPLNTVGELGKAYAENTYALRKSSNKIKTLCIAAKRCKDEDPE